MFLNRHTPSGQSRVHRVTQLRNDGVHFRESAGTGPVNLKVVRFQTGAALAGHHGPINMRPSFPHPLMIRSGHVESILNTGIIITNSIYSNNIIVGGKTRQVSEPSYLNQSINQLSRSPRWFSL